MLDWFIIPVSAVIGSLSGVIATYVILRKFQNSDVFIEIFEDFVADLSENPDMQRKVYVIGGILGSGIRQGIGITKGKGKLKLEDIIMQFVSGYIQNKVMPQGNQTSTTPVNPLLQNP